MTVDGVGEHTAVLIQLLPQFARRYHQDRVKMDSAVNRMEDAGTLLAPYFYGAKREMVYLLSLDARGRVLGCDLLGEMCIRDRNIVFIIYSSKILSTFCCVYILILIIKT